MSQEKAFMVLAVSFSLVMYILHDTFAEILSWDRVICCNMLRFMTQIVNKDQGMKKLKSYVLMYFFENSIDVSIA